MAIDPGKLDTAVAAFLDVGLAEDGWTRALDALAAALDASVIVVLPVSDRAPGPFPCSSQAADPVDCYVRGRWYEHDIRRRAISQIHRKVIFDDNDSMPYGELVRTDYYNEVLRPFDFGPYLAMTLPFAGEMTALSIQRSTRVALLTPEDLRRLAAVRDRLMFGAELASRIDRAHLAGHGEAIAALAQPCALLDRMGRVIQLNDAAVALEARGLVIRDGQIQSPNAENNRQFRDFVRAAVWSPASPDAPVRSPTFFLQRAGRLPLVVRVSVLRGRAWHYFSRAWAIVLFTDPEARPAVSGQTLAGLYGLTPAEFRITELVVSHGAGAAGIAQVLGLSRNTVKFHLANIFSKTGTRSVAELISVVTGVCGPG